MTYVPTIDEDVCAAHGECVWIAPEVFELDGIATVKGTGPDKTILEAARACPTSAISVTDDNTGEQIFP
jgi:ferredoxin